MNLLVKLIEYALGEYYPEKDYVLDDVTYPSKRVMYDEWFNGVYFNGRWYIGENTDDALETVERKILKVFLISDTSKTDNKYGIGVIVENFKPSHEIKIVINNNNEDVFTFKNYTVLNDTVSIYGELISDVPINSVQLNAEEVILNYWKYTAVNTISLNSNDMNTMDYNDFLNNYNAKMNNIRQIATKLENTSPYPTFRLKFDLETHTNGVADFYRGANVSYSQNFSETQSEIHFTTLVSYDKCALNFDDGSRIIVSINTKTVHDWTNRDYVVKF